MLFGLGWVFPGKMKVKLMQKESTSAKTERGTVLWYLSRGQTMTGITLLIAKEKLSADGEQEGER